MSRVWGTWRDDNGVRHIATGIKQTAPGHMRWPRREWDTNVYCHNKYVDVEPVTQSLPVTCLRCIWMANRPHKGSDVLRGLHADYTVIDEPTFFDISMITEPADRSGS